MSETTAKLLRLRMSPRKIRLVVDMIRGLSVQYAEQQLQFSEKKAALPLLKLLRSATANAKNRFHEDAKNLYIKKIVAHEGVALKRSRPRAFGRSTTIKKRTTHIELILDTKKET